MLFSCSVVPYSLWPQGLKSARFLCPWNFSGKKLELIAISYSRGSSWPRDPISNSCIGRCIPYHCTTWEDPYIYIYTHTHTYMCKCIDVYTCTHIYIYFSIYLKNSVHKEGKIRARFSSTLSKIWNDTEKISMAPAQGWHANSWSVPY